MYNYTDKAFQGLWSQVSRISVKMLDFLSVPITLYIIVLYTYFLLSNTYFDRLTDWYGNFKSDFYNYWSSSYLGLSISTVTM